MPLCGSLPTWTPRNILVLPSSRLREDAVEIVKVHRRASRMIKVVGQPLSDAPLTLQKVSEKGCICSVFFQCKQ